MTALASQVAIGIALRCRPPSRAPIAAGIAPHENPKLVLQAVDHNVNGTFDYGLAQINSTNFAWMRTPVNERTILDLCINFHVSMRALFARYNGNPPDVLKAAYAADVMAKIQAGAEAPSEAQANNDDPQPPTWEARSVVLGRLRTQERPVATSSNVPPTGASNNGFRAGGAGNARGPGWVRRRTSYFQRDGESAHASAKAH